MKKLLFIIPLLFLLNCKDADVKACLDSSTPDDQKKLIECSRGCSKTDDKASCENEKTISFKLCEASPTIDKSIDSYFEPCSVACKRGKFEFACKKEIEGNK